jgi:tripartite-type tricarboxylate transporter receptor subunit TctC
MVMSHQSARVAVCLAGTAVIAMLVPAICFGQSYPTKPIRIVTPLSVGSQTDILARLISQKMSEKWHQPVIVENRPGGAGAIAGGILVKAVQMATR